MSGIVEQIVKFGKVTRPVLGISFAPEQSVEQLGVSGVLVLDAPPAGPAGKAVSSSNPWNSLSRALATYLPDSVSFFHKPHLCGGS